MCRTHRSPGPTATEPAEDRLSLQAKLDLVNHEYRRDLLTHLKESGQNSVSFETATENILEQRDTSCHDGVDAQTLKASLLHVHLPKFEEAGVMEFDQRSQTIRYDGHDQLESLVECLRTCHSP